jgi:hypothetical protein
MQRDCCLRNAQTNLFVSEDSRVYEYNLNSAWQNPIRATEKFNAPGSVAIATCVIDEVQGVLYLALKVAPYSIYKGKLLL